MTNLESKPYQTVCGFAFWDSLSCGTCDNCRAEKERAGRLIRAAHWVIAVYRNDHSHVYSKPLDLALQALQVAMENSRPKE